MTTKGKNPIRVVFLLFYFEAWDSLASVYEQMRLDPDFDPVVVTIPRKLTGDEGYGGERLVHEFLVEQDVAHVRLRGEDFERDSRRLRNLEPDYIFLNYPWQRNYPPAFRVDKLVEFTRVAYIPYFLLPLVNEVSAQPNDVTPAERPAAPVAEHLFEQRTHQLASLVFCQDQATRDAFALTERGNGYVHATGSPKLDALRQNAARAKRQIEKRAAKRARRGKTTSKYDLRVLWAPHHSYSPAWLNFGMFKRSYQEMLSFATEHPRIKITFRPHPFLLGTLVDRSVITTAELEAWLSAWNALPNTKTSSKAQFVKQFMRADYLLTDGISFLAEYPLLTERPAIFLENPDHWEFNAVGELAAACNVRISSVGEFTQMMRAQIQNPKPFPDFTHQIEQLRAVADPYPGKTAAVICDIVKRDFASSSGLVDPDIIKTPAWENRPGREPQAD